MDNGISDHGPAFVAVGFVPVRPLLPRWVAEGGRFLDYVVELLAATPEESDPWRALPRALRLLRDVLGDRARRLLVDVSQILRPQPHAGGSLAEDHGLLYDHVVELLPSQLLAAIFSEEGSIAQADFIDGERARRTARLRRQADCWSRSRPRVHLGALLRDDGAVITDDSEATEALRAHWESVFAQDPCDAESD